MFKMCGYSEGHMYYNTQMSLILTLTWPLTSQGQSYSTQLPLVNDLFHKYDDKDYLGVSQGLINRQNQVSAFNGNSLSG